MSSEYNITSKTIRFSLHIYQFRNSAAAITVAITVTVACITVIVVLVTESVRPIKLQDNTAAIILISL